MNALGLMLDARRVHKQGAEILLRRQEDRLAEIVTYARNHSAYYRELYHGLPERVSDAALLPVVSKKTLMARFDDWVTDPGSASPRSSRSSMIPLGSARNFLANTQR